MFFKEPEGQVACWLEELQLYDFTVVHRATLTAALYCTRELREAHERELCAEEGVGASVCQVSVPVCCELQAVKLAKWRQQQDTDLQPVLEWVEVRLADDMLQ